ncbi:hypothetical protein E5161_15820 [Cohnella pontilimi]|uniref:Pyruvate kinase n=1 Tax=Cohnella pontilimi TaxID=2564100 RepID=A0A4U0F8T1_9BACL|nr:pyruvate kinase [Cohnella pontilimi]TJY41156.1 hypothetical protein E5161_15820 [Cohnella pontilimi]
MNSLSHRDFVNRVWKLYLQAINQSSPLYADYPSTEHRYSAHNLLAFLAFRNGVTHELITALRLRGLQLGSIQHVVRSLHMICFNLGILFQAPLFSLEDPHLISNKRVTDLLGDRPAHSPHIMLTLDSKMIDSPLIEEFLIRGMTIARINCAYDDESIWKKMIQTVRNAENGLRRKGQYGERNCKIYMDLAGPKIRIKPLQKTVYPLKITVPKDWYGRPSEPKRGIVSSSAPSTKLSDGPYDFQISVFHEDGQSAVQEGDRLSFLDARNKKRTFLIQKVMPDGVVVSLDRTACIEENTKLYNAERQLVWRVRNLEGKMKKVLVKTSDRLRIYMNKPLAENDADEAEIAGISVNLPEAFAHIEQGHSVFIDDGKVHGIVKDHNRDYVDVEILSPPVPIALKENKGVNLPDSRLSLSLPALTEKDIQDLTFICRHADLAGLSFVNHPQDLRVLKHLLHTQGKPDFPIIAKIETREAVQHFSSILIEGLTFANFGVMVARGDLAIEIGFPQLSVVQEEILSMCRAAHTPVILATQILDTYTKKGIPSRPEMADVSLGSEFDCLMLNKGPFMKQAIELLKETLFLISEVKHYKQSVTRPFLL